MKKTIVKTVAPKAEGLIINNNATKYHAKQFSWPMFKSLCYHNNISANFNRYTTVVNELYNKHGQQATADMASAWIESHKLPAEMARKFEPTEADREAAKSYREAIKSAKSYGKELNFATLEEMHQYLRDGVNNNVNSAMLEQSISSYTKRLIKILESEKVMRLSNQAKAEAEAPKFKQSKAVEPEAEAPEIDAEMLKMLKMLKVAKSAGLI